MKSTSFSFLLLVISFTLSTAKQEDETLVNVPKITPTSAINAALFNVNEACKDSTNIEICISILKSLGGDKDKVKASKFSDKVVKHAQSVFGKVSIKARKEMREDKAKVAVKKALSHCVKFYLDMNNELRGLMAIGLKTSNYGNSVDQFSKMAENYPRLCEEGLKHAGTSGEQLGLYDNVKDLEDLGNIVSVVTLYVSVVSSQNAGGQENNEKQD